MSSLVAQLTPVDRPAHTHPLRVLSKVLLCGILTLWVTAASPARAEAFCDAVTVLITQAQSNFSQAQGSGAEGSAASTRPRPLPGAERCTEGRALSGANAYHCAWSFAYRDAAAMTAFDGIRRDLRSCLGDRAVIGRDQSVNHPDFYDQRRYQLGKVAVTVSLKDKSAAQRSYVFIGVHGPASD